MGDRGSKSVICNNVAVKEQRVDGSSVQVKKKTGSVRCTLVTGKPALGRLKFFEFSRPPKASGCTVF